MNERELSRDKEEKVTGYANPLCDFMFKRLFGSEANKDILIEFLNIVLEDSDIVGVDFIPTEHHGLTEEDRKVIFDIECKCKDGKKFIIEVQKGYQKHFRERALYYTTYPINEQGRYARDIYFKKAAQGDADAEFRWDYNLKPVTVVAILNFRFEHVRGWPADRYHSSYRLREDVSDEVMTDVLRFVFLELGRFKKKLGELDSKFDKWMFLLKHMHEMTEIPEEFSDPVFKRLFMMSELSNFTADELKHYYISLENMGDYLNIINTAKEEAQRIGLEQGREQGKTEAKIEVARKMIAAGIPLDQVVEFTGLEVETVNGLG